MLGRGRHLRLLGGIVRRCGAHLLPYIPQLRECVDLGLASDEESVRTEAARTLRHALRGMAETYVTDTRSVSPARWQAGYLWHAWGAPTSWSPEDVSVQWHSPTQEERIACQTLFQEYVATCLVFGTTTCGAWMPCV